MRETEPGIYGVVGNQWGDEGKGKIVDYLVPEFGGAARFAGGPNAGHTIVHNDVKYDLHQHPSAILYPEKINIIGNGTLLEPALLADEIEINRNKGLIITPERLFISTHAQLITPVHRSRDQITERGKGRQGSTQSGIRYAASDKGERTGFRAEVLLNGCEELEQRIADALNALNKERADIGLEIHNGVAEARQWIKKAKSLQPYLTNTPEVIIDYLADGGSLLAEGAQGYWLDVEQGWWPFVTSSDTTTAGIPKGLGIAPWHVTGAIGVVKAYKSRVGDGPFITEFDDPVLTEKVRGPEGAVDRESGTTTGRDRRLGWLDAVEVRQANEINGTEKIALTRLDSLEAFGGCMRIAVAYKKNGEVTRNFPESVHELPEPVYNEVGLWTPDMTPRIRSARTYKELAKPVRNLINVIEHEIEADIVLIGTGPGREQIIDRR